MNLVVRKIIPASPERLFAAWTEPEQLRQWWGPESVVCIEAEVDLRVGGRYRIGNQFPDGRVMWITGTFHHIDSPRKLVYSWHIEPDSRIETGFKEELVTVSFDRTTDGRTEITVTHERISDRTARDGHQQGWVGCLDKLAAYVSRK
jgi:uncharacterized protein YndB with AHSA1/START domain